MITLLETRAIQINVFYRFIKGFIFTWSEIMDKTCAPKDAKRDNEILRTEESIWLIR